MSFRQPVSVDSLVREIEQLKNEREIVKEKVTEFVRTSIQQKDELEKQNKSLESEVSTLRQKVSELEYELNTAREKEKRIVLEQMELLEKLTENEKGKTPDKEKARNRLTKLAEKKDKRNSMGPNPLAQAVMLGGLMREASSPNLSLNGHHHGAADQIRLSSSTGDLIRRSSLAGSGRYGEEGDVDTIELSEITGGTTEQLIKYLYSAHSSTTEYIKIFLLTYRSFTNPSEILIIIGKLFEIESQNDDASSKAKRLRIINFLKKWVDEYFHDFAVDKQINKELCSQFIALADNIISKAEEKLGKTLAERITTKMNNPQSLENRLVKCFDESPPKPIAPKSSKFEFGDLSPVEIARQMTLIEFSMFCEVEPKEFLGLAWSKKDKENLAPKLLAISRRFNDISMWVALTLVKEPNLKKRGTYLKKFVSVAEECRKLNNFNGIFEILGGIGNSSVHRMKKSFEGLSRDKQQILDELRTMTLPERSWKNYRELLHTVDPPCIPFIGVYQTDLTFIEEGNRDRNSDGTINFKKCKLIAEVIKDLQQYQQKPYNLSVLPAIQSFLLNTENLIGGTPITEQDLFTLSLIAEPRT